MCWRCARCCRRTTTSEQVIRRSAPQPAQLRVRLRLRLLVSQQPTRASGEVVAPRPPPRLPWTPSQEQGAGGMEAEPAARRAARVEAPSAAILTLLLRRANLVGVRAENAALGWKRPQGNSAGRAGIEERCICPRF